MRYVAVTVVIALSASLAAQSSALAFDVASIKPSAPGGRAMAPGAVGPPQGGNVRFPRGTVRTLLDYALGLQPLQRHDSEPVGGPDWVNTDQFDIVAKGPADLTLADARRMMLTLLEERFKLKTHNESRETSVYVLVTSRPDRRLGPGLKVSGMDCGRYSAVLSLTGRRALAELEGPDCGLASGDAQGFGASGASSSYPLGAQRIHGTATMTEIVNALARYTDRPIIDRTGLSGTFDIDLHWVPERIGTIVADPSDVLPLFTALTEQPGLKLEPSRLPINLVVIDHIERPTEN